MFVIITYDVERKRVGKVCKKLREYLDWSQNSVFEGEITKGKLTQCLAELNNIIDNNVDSIYLYQVSNPKNLKKTVYGIAKSPMDWFL
ncbi:CRISPR-associated endonuclease Cas2 [Alkalihalobacillus oceani]|uniref:CRISPR-associated endoribonuclease Cas2 n=1 Tax=Halalkalibacter oceani TaxID=1653776 RepID=A0A9X2DTY9_9BACI|nr:CRISPR-associated endonuclease Cas2 [Halalkalibacter oceani]MCM3716328.1 CRISPR-associated endonuclease Cas2 [Halalkalibacter oceani]MCM3761180.1 CRISPR-associated endonuclease Cas2 [Halalkalibacter oceani]